RSASPNRRRRSRAVTIWPRRFRRPPTTSWARGTGVISWCRMASWIWPTGTPKIMSSSVNVQYCMTAPRSALASGGQQADRGRPGRRGEQGGDVDHVGHVSVDDGDDRTVAADRHLEVVVDDVEDPVDDEADLALWTGPHDDVEIVDLLAGDEGPTGAHAGQGGERHERQELAPVLDHRAPRARLDGGARELLEAGDRREHQRTTVAVAEVDDEDRLAGATRPVVRLVDEVGVAGDTGPDVRLLGEADGVEDQGDTP